MTPAPFQQHSETSREAADSLTDQRRITDADMILDLLRHQTDGLTDEEIQRGLKMDGSTERPRRIELCHLFLVYDSGMKRVTSSGRRATVWRAVA